MLPTMWATPQPLLVIFSGNRLIFADEKYTLPIYIFLRLNLKVKSTNTFCNLKPKTRGVELKID